MTCPKLAVCLRVQQKKCLVFVKSVCMHCPCSYICLTVPHPLSVPFKTVSAASRFVFRKSFGERWRRKEQQRSREWREKEDESSAVFTVWSLGGILLPFPASALPPLTSGRCSQVREGRSGGGGLCCGRGGRLCRSPVFSSQGQDPPPSPLLLRTSREETESVVRMKNKKRWAATTAIVWLDCFGQSWGTDWDCSCLGGHHWAGRLSPRFPDLLSSPASPG